MYLMPLIGFACGAWLRDRRAYPLSIAVLAVYSVGVWIFTDEFNGAGAVGYLVVVLGITLLFARLGMAARRWWQHR